MQEKEENQIEDIPEGEDEVVRDVRIIIGLLNHLPQHFKDIDPDLYQR